MNMLKLVLFSIVLAGASVRARDTDASKPSDDCSNQIASQSPTQSQSTLSSPLTNLLAAREALLSITEKFPDDPDRADANQVDSFLAQFTLMPLRELPGGEPGDGSRLFNHLLSQHAVAIENWLNATYPETQVKVGRDSKTLLFRRYLSISGTLKGKVLGERAALLIPDFDTAGCDAEPQLARYLRRMRQLHSLGYGFHPGRRLVAGKLKHWVAQLVELPGPVVWGDSLPDGFDTRRFVAQLVPIGQTLEQGGLLLIGRIALGVSASGKPLIVDYPDYGPQSELGKPTVDTHWGSLNHWYDRFNAELDAAGERSSLSREPQALTKEWRTLVSMRDQFEKWLLIALYISNTQNDEVSTELSVRAIERWAHENAESIQNNLQIYSTHGDFSTVRLDAQSLREFRDLDQSFDSYYSAMEFEREARCDRLVSILASALRALEETRIAYETELGLGEGDSDHTQHVPSTVPSPQDFDWSRRMVDWNIARTAGERQRPSQLTHFVDTVARAWRRVGAPTYPKTFVFFVYEWTK